MAKSTTEQLKCIRDEIIGLEESPLYSYRTENGYYPVIGQGSHEAEIMCVGEAPGETEAKKGIPFCGAAGRVLDELLSEVGLSREDIYITNLLKDRPPSNRDPRPEEIELYAPFLDRQMYVLRPRVILALGRFSAEYLMKRYGNPDKVTGITKMHGQEYAAAADDFSFTLIPLFHPAAALYDSSKRETLIEDMKHAAQVAKG